MTIALLGACATPAPVPVERAKYALSDFEKPDAPRLLAVSDPIEPVNRAMYRFNYYFDRFVFLPVVDAYRSIMPNYVRARISNFFDNVGELKNFMNGALQ